MDEGIGIDLVGEAVKENSGDVSQVELRNILVSDLCDYCEHVITKDD
jgi:hypothetical protein